MAFDLVFTPETHLFTVANYYDQWVEMLRSFKGDDIGPPQRQSRLRWSSRRRYRRARPSSGRPMSPARLRISCPGLYQVPAGHPFSVHYSVFERSMSSGLTRGWNPVRVKKTRQNNNPELRF
jgi:hypothetical protein